MAHFFGPPCPNLQRLHSELKSSSTITIINLQLTMVILCSTIKRIKTGKRKEREKEKKIREISENKMKG